MEYNSPRNPLRAEHVQFAVEWMQWMGEQTPGRVVMTSQTDSLQ